VSNGVKDRVRTAARVKNMNRNLRVRPDSEGLTLKIKRKNLKGYINVDGLPVGNTPPRTGGQCKPVNHRAKGPPKP
jgi:hypothetical protein